MIVKYPLALSLALFGLLSPTAHADSLLWAPKQGTLEKPDYSTAPAIYRTASAEGVDVTFKLTHKGTSPGLFTYSKWDIDRWGDPAGVITPPGSWQAVSDASNKINLALWGYWGNGGSPLTSGATTSYEVEIQFARPVNDLAFRLDGINAVLSAAGANAFDEVTLASFLEGVAQPSPTYTNAGNGFTQTGDVLTGDFAQLIGTDTGNASTSDQGSINVSFAQVIDSVVLTFIATAQHPTPASFQDAVQNWSFGVGDLSFEPLPAAGRSTLSWLADRGTLSKEAYDDSTVTFTAPADDDSVNATFTLAGLGTTGDKFSYSKWEIDRWGDPTGVLTPPGSWQVTSNSFNDVVLGLWGYWGTDGSAGAPPTEIGDETGYSLKIAFDKPVSELEFQLNTINALLSGGFNSVDELTVTSSLGGTAQPAPTFSNEGPGFTRVGNVLTGDFASQIGGGFQNVTDEGSAVLRFPGAVDEIVITLVNKADHPQPAQFQGGPQTWSFSIGDLSFVPGIGTEILWAPRQGQLVKPGFNNASATYQVPSEDGGVNVTFDLNHVATTGNAFSYSQWEIHRWGDPNGIILPTGSWQMVSDSQNNIVLGLWGYWGGGGVPLASGDQTSYELILSFDQPVRNLDFALCGINALVKSGDGFNSFDILTVSSSLNSVAQPSPTYSQEGNAFTRSGDTFTGDFDNQIVGLFGGQHVSDAGCSRLSFGGPVDEVRLVIVNRAEHPTAGQFQGGQQTWSFSMGDLSFDYDGESGTAPQIVASGPRETELSPARTDRLELVRSSSGDLILRTTSAMANQRGAWQVESSEDLQTWSPWSAPTAVDEATTWWLGQDDLGNARQRYFRLMPSAEGLE